MWVCHVMSCQLSGKNICWDKIIGFMSSLYRMKYNYVDMRVERWKEG